MDVFLPFPRARLMFPYWRFAARELTPSTSSEVNFAATQPGEYAVTITCNTRTATWASTGSRDNLVSAFRRFLAQGLLLPQLTVSRMAFAITWL
jgi:hypothetical protein